MVSDSVKVSTGCKGVAVVGLVWIVLGTSNSCNFRSSLEVRMQRPSGENLTPLK